MKARTVTGICVWLSLQLGLLPIADAVAQTVPTSAMAGSSSTAVGIDPAFDPQFVLNDGDIFDVDGMSLSQLKNFLATHGGLGSYKIKDIDGVETSAAAIIWRIAGSYKVNPKYLLALMQKEQSLVDDPHPSQRQLDWATGYAICDVCSMDDPALQPFKGFANQLEWAAKQHREKYLLQILGRGKTVAGYAPGKPVLIDGHVIIPQNQATAMLYSYTPHIHGNLNLWRIWRRWFSLHFPDGSVVRGKTSGDVYLIHSGQRRPFKSRAVIASLIASEKIVTVEDSQIAAYPVGHVISLPNYALVEAKHKRYLIVADEKRLIVSLKAFHKVGFNEDEVIPVSDTDLADYSDGPDITAETSYPTGLLVKDIHKQRWYVQDGVRHLIPNKILVALYFSGRPARSISAKKLSAFPIGEPYRLHDGELVRQKGDPGIFVMENGLRRPIPQSDVFEAYGWKWHNVITLPKDILETYAIGQPIETNQPTASLALNADLASSTTGLAVSSTRSAIAIK